MWGTRGLGWAAVAVGLSAAVVGSAPTQAGGATGELTTLTSVTTAIVDLAPTGPTPASADGSLPDWAPVVSSDLGPMVRTCRTWRGRTTPTDPRACTGWDSGGPLNLVVVGPVGTDPAALVEHAQGWRPATGRWLVAEAQAVAGPAGCAPGWTASGVQVEQRLDGVTRHHFKVVATTCSRTPAGPVQVVMGEAHTDVYDVRSCHGDRSVSWDMARDRLVAALRAHAGNRVHVVYVRVHPSGIAFAGGCGQTVRSDGRVAYVLIDPVAPAPRHS